VTGVRPLRSRIFAVVLVAAILVHAVLLVPAVEESLSAKTPTGYNALQMAAVVLAGLTVSAILFIGWRSGFRLATVAMLVIVGTALLTPGVVLLVALMLANAYVVGGRVLRWVGTKAEGYRAVPWIATLLVGSSIWIGVMAASASLEVHFLPVYALALALPLILGHVSVRDAFVSLWQALRRQSPPSPTEAAWLALLTAVALVHLFVVAKPDVGYDANAMHLEFARLLAARHRWSFDVTRYVWADMPLGADLSYAAAYILGGEAAARLVNFAFGVLACQVTYQLIRRYASSEVALASVCLLASMPLGLLETGSLHVENLWTAFLLATLLMVLDYARTRSATALAACALLAAGAMQTKVIGVIWLAPIVAAVIVLLARGRGDHGVTGRCGWVLVCALVIAAWPYVNAWVRTGNPVFPFMNDLFRSPYFGVTRAFSNPVYEAPLRWTSLHDIFLASGRYIEGSDGAAGWHWLLLLPVIAVAFLLRRRPAVHWLCLGLAAVFFCGVFSQQAYLRYLLPFLMLTAVLGGWALQAVVINQGTRTALVVVGGILCLLNLRFIYTASWWNETLCPRCAIEDKARRNYLATYGPDRVVADYLNLSLPTARIGFFMLNAQGESGYLGYSRSANWHDVPVYGALIRATKAEDVLAVARDFRLTHAVIWEPPWDASQIPVAVAISAFRDRYTTPVWRFQGRVVAAIKPE
jgi:hypothetical protein